MAKRKPREGLLMWNDRIGGKLVPQFAQSDEEIEYFYRAAKRDRRIADVILFGLLVVELIFVTVVAPRHQDLVILTIPLVILIIGGIIFSARILRQTRQAIEIYHTRFIGKK